MTDKKRDPLVEVIHSAVSNCGGCDRIADAILSSDWLAVHDAAVTARAHAPALALADEWEAEASRYTEYGKGRSPSHRQCRQIAHTLAESAQALRAVLDPAAATQHDTR